MTIKIRNVSNCKGCNSKLVCPQCQTEHTCTTRFSDWIRVILDDSKNYDVENLDFIRFHYREGWLITIEEKCYGASPSMAQKDTHNIISQMLMLSSGEAVNTLRGYRPIEYKGHYIVSFEKTHPANSDWVRINGERYNDVTSAVTKLLKKGTLKE